MKRLRNPPASMRTLATRYAHWVLAKKSRRAIINKHASPEKGTVERTLKEQGVPKDRVIYIPYRASGVVYKTKRQRK